MMGEGNDTVLAHITPQEAELLKKKGGSGRINPATGLPMFEEGDGGGGNGEGGGNGNGNGNGNGEGNGNDNGNGATSNGGDEAAGKSDSDVSQAEANSANTSQQDTSPQDTAPQDTAPQDVDMSNPMDATFGYGKTSALTDIANTINDTLSSVVNDIAARSAAVNSSPPSPGVNPGRGSTFGGPSLGDIDAAQQAANNATAIAAAMANPGNQAAMAANNAASQNTASFGKSDKDTSAATNTGSNSNANANANENANNTNTATTQDSSTTKGADLSNDNAVSVNDTANSAVDPTLYGVNPDASGTTKVAGVTTPNTPATTTADTKPAYQQNLYDVALNDLITAFGKDKALQMIKGNPLSSVTFAKGGKVKQSGPLAMMKRKSKRA
jgi:hypothetical protein